MIDPLRPAAATRLHLLDEGGVLFNEQSQAVCILNPSAAFVWCCLADGLERDKVLAAIEQDYGVARAEAERQIELLFGQLKELGLLAGTERNSGTGTPPKAQQRARDPAECSADAPSSFHSERTYRLLTTPFRLRYASPLQEAAVHPVLAHLETPASAMATPTAVDLICDGERHLLLLNGRSSEGSAALAELAPLVKRALLSQAVSNCSYLLCLHAAAVRVGTACLLLPAAPGSGKSSLTAALIRAGFMYLADDVALLEEDTLNVRPVPVSLCLKESGWDMLASRYPELLSLAAHLRWDGKVVRYLNPPHQALDAEPETSHRVRWIVFPRYMPGAPTALRPLRRTYALHRLLEQCRAMPKPLDQAEVARLVRWIAVIPCFEMPMSSLDEAVALVHDLCRCQR